MAPGETAAVIDSNAWVGFRRGHQCVVLLNERRTDEALALVKSVSDLDELIYMQAGVREAAVHCIGLLLAESRPEAEARREAFDAERFLDFDASTPEAQTSARLIITGNIFRWAGEALRAAEEVWPDQAERSRHFSENARFAYEWGQ